MRSPRRLLGLLLVPALLAGCTGGGEETTDPDTAATRLESAATALADAERLDFSLAVDGELPSGVQGLESAKGFGNRTPAFDGDVTIATGGTSLSAEVVAVDGQVWAKLGFSPDFFTIDPAEYGAPDPAQLIGLPGEGIVSLLAEVDVAKASQERDGKDVLTAITGAVPGDLVAALIPSADAAADFDVVVRLTEDDEIRDVTLTGGFYPDADEVTYVVTVSASSESSTIEAPVRTGGA
ncbi:LppX_LprAFG lipoprotein [Aeromicrobium sp. Leaf350]|uniref:LppX_LprAFG lipoprotein n=1 Tax=Aeromicrobium sp. Leaf350 TaxID=2876565 RepID=UPI001E3089F1|nr:LppX_LprAFG lipoprotein [Aeromicrobium sp. Leaf350]